MTVDRKAVAAHEIPNYFKVGEIVTLSWEDKENQKSGVFCDIRKGDDRAFAPAEGDLQPGEAPVAGGESQAHKSICEAVGAHWRQPAKYKVLAVCVQGDWAIFDGIPASVANAAGEEAKLQAGRTLRSGTDAIAAVLRCKEGKWRVVESWPHSDIPSPGEFKNGETRELPDSLITAYFNAISSGG